MEKDTKQETEVKETTPEENEEEYYDDNDNYIIGKVLKGNIKDDPASVRSRPRNTPVSRLTLSDEDKIPKMPEKILPMPLSQEEYDKKRKEFIERMNKKRESIKKCYDDMKKENLGSMTLGSIKAMAAAAAVWQPFGYDCDRGGVSAVHYGA